MKAASGIFKRLYNLREAAHYLGRPVWSIRELVWRGAIPRIQDGRKIYLTIEDLDAYIDRHRRTEIDPLPSKKHPKR